MYKIISITNRRLCKENFLERIEKIAAARPDSIILREKDLTEEEYYILSASVNNICEKYSVPLILHSFPLVAERLSLKKLHMPLEALSQMTDKERSFFEVLGASCHSLDDVKKAEKLGCTYVTAGHIFDTDCKKGLPGRGKIFLSDIYKNAGIPVIALGGIDESNISSLKDISSGAAVMSLLMTGENPELVIKKLREKTYGIQ